MNLQEIMKTRRSIRTFKDIPIPESTLEEIIAMAITAPSASNKQPWRFIICINRVTINCLALAVQKNIDSISKSIPANLVASFENYGNYFVRFADAPAVIIPICRSIQTLSHLVDENLSAELTEAIKNMEEKSALVSTSLAVQNLLLYAHSIGLGTSCVTGPLLAEKTLKKILNVPNGWDIPCLIPIGYANEEPQPTGRKELDKQIKWIK